MGNQDIQPTADVPPQLPQPMNPPTPPEEPTPKSRKPLLIASFVIVGVLIIAGVISGYVWWQKVGDQEQVVLEKEFRYETESFTEDGRDNFRLVSYSQEGSKETIFPSLRMRDLGLISEGYLTLFKYSFPEKGDYLFFRSGLPNTGGGFGDIVSYNIKTKEFSRVEFDGDISELSPDGMMVVGVSQDGKNLYLIDLLANEYTSMVSLGDKESISSVYLEGGGFSLHEIKWIDDKTIEYGIFDNSKPEFDPETGEYVDRLIEYRTINI